MCELLALITRLNFANFILQCHLPAEGGKATYNTMGRILCAPEHTSALISPIGGMHTDLLCRVHSGECGRVLFVVDLVVCHYVNGVFSNLWCAVGQGR